MAPLFPISLTPPSPSRYTHLQLDFLRLELKKKAAGSWYNSLLHENQRVDLIRPGKAEGEHKEGGESRGR